MTQLIRLKAVLDQTQMSKATLYRKIDAGEFPKPVKLGERMTAWPADEVEEWVSDRISERG